MDIIEVPGATGYIDTNYENKAAYAVEALKKSDFLYLHVEAPDEAAHEGSLEKKMQAISDLDSRLLAPLLKGLDENFPAYRVLVMPDHPTPIRLKTHTSEPVPFLLYDNLKDGPGSLDGYNEKTAAAADNHFAEGWRLQKHFINKGI
jgi:2,3-bisphosphoglycerate-independent phosphoglycerate mutase